MPEDEIADVPPNHLSIDPRSPFYNEEALIRGVGIRFNGAEKTNVYEYDVAEGWVRVEAGTHGNVLVTPQPIYVEMGAWFLRALTEKN